MTLEVHATLEVVQTTLGYLLVVLDLHSLYFMINQKILLK